MIQPGEPRVVTDGVVTLREVRGEDSELLYRWRMHPDSRPSFRSTAEVPFAVHQRFFEAYFDPANDDCWLMVERQGRPVGAMAIYHRTPDGSAEWGRAVIDPDQRRQGLARRAFALLLDYARQLGLRRVYVELLATNLTIQRIHQELGFARYGEEQHGGRLFYYFEHLLEPPA